MEHRKKVTSTNTELIISIGPYQTHPSQSGGTCPDNCIQVIWQAIPNIKSFSVFCFKFSDLAYVSKKIFCVFQVISISLQIVISSPLVQGTVSQEL